VYQASIKFNRSKNTSVSAGEVFFDMSVTYLAVHKVIYMCYWL